jgi:hypothetical protein
VVRGGSFPASFLGLHYFHSVAGVSPTFTFQYNSGDSTLVAMAETAVPAEEDKPAEPRYDEPERPAVARAEGEERSFE